MEAKEKQYEWRTGITTYSDKEIRVRGYSIVDLIEHVDFSSVIYLTMQGELPTENQAKVLNAVLVAVVDHGIAPSEMVTRFVAASGVPLQACVAGGLLTVGDIHGGAGEAFARMIQERILEAKEGGKSVSDIAKEIVQEARAEKKRLDGFGHPMHPSGDPRAPILIEMAKRYEVAGSHVELAEALEDALAESRGRRIPLNADGATAAILSDLGFSWRYARPLLLVSRSAGLAAHAVEEIDRERGWRSVNKEGILYDGPGPREIGS
jgi:citrate synthase/citryl-CoA lyase